MSNQYLKKHKAFTYRKKSERNDLTNGLAVRSSPCPMVDKVHSQASQMHIKETHQSKGLRIHSSSKHPPSQIPLTCIEGKNQSGRIQTRLPSRHSDFVLRGHLGGYSGQTKCMYKKLSTCQ